MIATHTGQVDMGDAIEVRDMPGVGGGRGVFACRDIAVGEVVLGNVKVIPACSCPRGEAARR